VAVASIEPVGWLTTVEGIELTVTFTQGKSRYVPRAGLVVPYLDEFAIGPASVPGRWLFQWA
jgi:hypothetical protein